MNTDQSLCVVGAAGRMGQAIVRCLAAGGLPGFRLSGAVDAQQCPVLGEDAGRVAGVAALGVPISSDLSQAADTADVIIDFSYAKGTVASIPHMAQWGRAWVIGTTGFSGEEKSAIEQAAGSVPIVMAPNMSLGVNLLLQLVQTAAQTIKDRGYDVEIIERHHRHKKDAPSGTALALGQAVSLGLEEDLERVARHGREGMQETERPGNEIGFHAVRAGDFVGDHTVLFAADGESIELSHRATSRDAFAMGALRAAEWVVGRPAGMYSMQDVLGL